MSALSGSTPRVTWHATPPTPAQQRSWAWLWARLLGHGDLGPKMQQPQDGHPEVVGLGLIAGNGGHEDKGKQNEYIIFDLDNQ